jgi:hypothetical protein
MPSFLFHLPCSQIVNDDRMYSWTRNGRSILLSSIKDARLQRYDILSNRVDRVATLPRFIRSSMVHPRNG